MFPLAFNGIKSAVLSYFNFLWLTMKFPDFSLTLRNFVVPGSRLVLLSTSDTWFHALDDPKIQNTKLLILLRFHFHDVEEQLQKTIHTNFRSEWVLGFVIDYAWISKLLRDAAFTWRPREMSCWLIKRLFPESLAIWAVNAFRNSIILIFLSSSRDQFTLL